ncbi:hypothetical protein GCM10027168_63550 [Streptomyces capparidis]
MAGDVVQYRRRAGARRAGGTQAVGAGDDQKRDAAQQAVGRQDAGVGAARERVAQTGGEVGQQAAAWGGAPYFGDPAGRRVRPGVPIRRRR